MSQLEVEVQPSVLVWARESIGLSRGQAAEKLKLFSADLQMWEEGHSDPTLPQLRAMAEVYQRPLAVLLLAEPLNAERSVPDFRMLPGNAGKRWSPKLHDAYRRIRMQRDVLIELAELREEHPSPISRFLRVSSDPEEAGEAIRAWLGTPSSSSDIPNAHFGQWVSLVEQRSILVAQAQGIAIDEMRGLSVSEEPFPVILINGKDTPSGKLFTLVHELVHVLLDMDALCDFGSGSARSTRPSEKVERFCNEAAAAALMPRSELVSDGVAVVPLEAKTWSDEELRRLAGRFEVSAESLLLRLVTLGFASKDYYFRRRHEFLRRYAQRDQEGAGGGDYYRMKLRDLGRRYVKTVFDAYHDKEISISGVADFLDMKVENIQKLERRLGEARA